MRAFRVSLNGKRLCLAGIGDDGVLTAIVSHATGRGSDSLGLDVGGLISPAKEHVIWDHLRLEPGDEVRIKIVESKSIDPPKERRPDDPKENLKSQKRYVRNMAKKLGW